jgi:ferredoxin-NADP reductase
MKPAPDIHLQRKEETMYALIYDEHNLLQPRKKIISVHRSRQTAETALQKRMRKLGRSVEECNTRIVWVEGKAKKGGYLTTADFKTWRPGEEIPEGELYSDTD